ncbi:MAG: hypothetical protein KatS3mg093_072 [Candidatus Parcubacteria bacterium]|nr:MAG: hypothetical protein KatS3mg093_072 [Candidatus Parcubacteria bacterium]
MIHFLLGIFTADLLFSLIILLKKNVFLGLNKNYILFSIIIDVALIGLILYYLKNDQKKKFRKT